MSSEKVTNSNVKEDQESSPSSIARKARLKKRREQRDSQKIKDLLDKDPCTPEEAIQIKKKKRLVRNREAAQASRERKKQFVVQLQEQVDQYVKIVQDLNLKM